MTDRISTQSHKLGSAPQKRDFRLTGYAVVRRGVDESARSPLGHTRGRELSGGVGRGRSG